MDVNLFGTNEFVNNKIIKVVLNRIFKKLIGFEKINSLSSEFSPSFFDDGIYYIVERGQEKALINNVNFLDNNDSLRLKERNEYSIKLKEILAYGSSISPRTFVYKMILDVSKLFNSHTDPIPDSAIIDNNITNILKRLNANPE